jgi:hypothetical protein
VQFKDNLSAIYADFSVLVLRSFLYLIQAESFNLAPAGTQLLVFLGGSTTVYIQSLAEKSVYYTVVYFLLSSAEGLQNPSAKAWPELRHLYPHVFTSW